MKICKTIPMFILLFMGYLCNNRHVAANITSLSSHNLSPVSKVIEDPELETPPPGSNSIPESQQSAVLVAGISISLVLLIFLVIIGIWCVWQKSEQGLAEINFVPSGEPGVSLK